MMNGLAYILELSNAEYSATLIFHNKRQTEFSWTFTMSFTVVNRNSS